MSPFQAELLVCQPTPPASSPVTVVGHTAIDPLDATLLADRARQPSVCDVAAFCNNSDSWLSFCVVS